ncbi:AAA-domain-containing protein [Atractiella rhizophila]|nr:AAA-domain-containing protein [Atractiella rhizophila]
MAPKTIPTKFLADVAILAIAQVAFYYTFKWVLDATDPTKSKTKDAKSKAAQALTDAGLGKRQKGGKLVLTEHEMIIAQELVVPKDIDCGFQDIGGLENIIGQLRESVIFPLTHPQVFESSAGLFGAPKGVLLHGPPGCGKTMLAKALAKESGAAFINLKMSTLTDKWFGESNKLVNAVFSLAKKLEPTIIFIDEIDSFLRQRSMSDHEVTGMKLLSLWDGLSTTSSSRVLVLGATNRVQDIDDAFLRRLPKRCPVPLPGVKERNKILSLYLRDIALEDKFSIEQVALETHGMSGSDLKELCREAAMGPVREFMRMYDGALEGKEASPSFEGDVFH